MRRRETRGRSGVWRSRWLLVLALLFCGGSAHGGAWAAVACAQEAATVARSADASRRRERGSALVAQGDHAAALVEFRAALALDPDDAASHDAVGVILGDQGQLDEAIAASPRPLAPTLAMRTRISTSVSPSTSAASPATPSRPTSGR